MGKNIVVAGLGHGGIAAAALLAKAGYDVTVYEKKSDGTLGYDWTDIFDPKALGVAEIPMPPEDKYVYKEDMTFCGPCGNNPLKQHVPLDKREIKMERRDIYNHLIDNALNYGVKIVYDCEVYGPLLDGDRVVGISTEKGDILGDLVIDACGVNSPVRRNMPKSTGVQNEIDRAHKISIYRAFFNKASDEPTEDKFKIVLFAGGKPGINWVASEDEYTDVLIGRFKEFDIDEVNKTLENLRKKNPRLGAEKLRGGQFVEIPIRHTLSVPVADGYAAIGDSAFMPVPLIGSGMANAFKAAKILADTIIEDGRDTYTAEALWKYAVKYHKELGAGLAPLECVRSALLKLRPQDVEYCFESGIVNSDDITMSADFGSMGDLFAFDKEDIKKKIKGATGNKYLIKTLGGAVGKMLKVVILSGQMPEEWDKEKVIQWSKKYDKAFM